MISSVRDATVLLWSGGKDAAMTLRAIRRGHRRDVCQLITTIIEDEQTVTMHGTPLSFIRKQAEALDLPLTVMRVPRGASNDVYERRLEAVLAPLRENGLRVVASGDLFLGDIRDYRQALFTRLGWEIVFPIWESNTSDLADTFIEEGYRAVVTSVDTTQIDASFAGRRYNRTLLADLPEHVDPCGEHGAFHTFVTGGPAFATPVPVTVRKALRVGRMARAQLAPNEEV